MIQIDDTVTYKKGVFRVENITANLVDRNGNKITVPIQEIENIVTRSFQSKMNNEIDLPISESV